jgi:transposase
MIKATRARYTLEFKQEVVRLVESGQSIAAASRRLGLVEQTLFNWVKAHREGTLKGADSRSKVTAEQMEISRLASRAGAGNKRFACQFVPWKKYWLPALIVVKRTSVVKLCRPGDSRKIEFLRCLSYHSQLGNSRSRIIPIDVGSNLFGIRLRDFRYRAKYRAYFM